MLEKLQHCVTDQKNELILFTHEQHALFLTNALSLLEANYSIGVVSEKIIAALALAITPTPIKGVYLYSTSLEEPSILCFSSGSIKHQKGVLRSFSSWKNSFQLIADLYTDTLNLKGIVLGDFTSSLCLFGVMESLFRKQQPLLFSSFSIRFFDKLNPKTNYLLWLTPLHCTFYIEAFKEGKILPQERIKYIFVGGAYFTNHQREKLQKVFPVAKVYAFFGTSETSFISIKPPTDLSDSVGTLCDGVKIQVRDNDTNLLPSTQVGNLWIKSNQLFSRYIDKRKIINSLDEFISIKDRGYIDEQNRLFFTGRSSRNISIGGHIISLSKLEQWYKNHLKKERIALIARTNATKENELVLISQTLLSLNEWTQLKHDALQALGPQGVPKSKEHCVNWPLLSNGKVDLNALKHMYQNG